MQNKLFEEITLSLGSSEEAQRVGINFLKKIDDNSIKKDILMNTSPDYSGKIEARDYEFFRSFLYTMNYEYVRKTRGELIHGA